MEVATIASHFFPSARMLSSPTSSRTTITNQSLTSSSSIRSSLSTNFISRVVGGSVYSDFAGQKIRHAFINPSSPSYLSSRGKRDVVTMVIPFIRGSPRKQPPPDLASYFFHNRIVYLGMSLYPPVTDLILAELLYLHNEDKRTPIYLYINSTGTTKGAEKLSYDTEAFAIYDLMSFIRASIFTLCVGNAWGEAALLLAAGSKGNRSALPSSSIMMKQPIGQFQGQVTDVENIRNEMKSMKSDLVELYAIHTGKTIEQIEEDIRRPKYFTPAEAVEYGIIDKVLYTERSREDRAVRNEQKRSQFI